jgi:hypothetical protein
MARKSSGNTELKAEAKKGAEKVKSPKVPATSKPPKKAAAKNR